MDSSSSSSHHSIVFHNINSDRRIFSPLYSKFVSEYGVASCIELLIAYYSKMLSESKIVCLCEVDNETEKNLREGLMKSFSDAHFMSVNYNNDAYSFKYFIAIPSKYSLIEPCRSVALTNNFEFVSNEERPATDEEKKSSIDYMERTGGEFYEKSFVHMMIGDGSSSFQLIVTHMGLGVPQRVKQAMRLNYWIRENCDAKIPLVIVGDFNAFDPVSGDICKEQMSQFEANGFEHAINYYTSTFEPLPYDILFKIKEASDISKYKEFIARSKSEKDSSVMEALSQEFYDFCKSVLLKETLPVALDNVFYRGITLCDCEITPQCCNSDHASVRMYFITD
jgi:hypothetical protein